MIREGSENRFYTVRSDRVPKNYVLRFMTSKEVNALLQKWLSYRGLMLWLEKRCQRQRRKGHINYLIKSSKRIKQREGKVAHDQ